MKSSLENLAVLGGQPAFERPLHVGRPHIGDRQALMSRLEHALDERWLTNHGRQVQELERRIAERLGVAHCVATCNGTVALQVAASAADLAGEVIVPSLSFVATAHALAWVGLKPVFCDVDPRSHNIDPHVVARMSTERTSGIVGVHLWGRPCDVEALSQVAEGQGLKLIFDAAHAFGCSYRGRMVGSFGDAEVLSFHATKLLNATEGGAIVTNDDHLAKRARLMMNFGFAGFDQVVSAGTNGKMSEFSAAMGLTSLESVDEFIAVNRTNYEAYRSGLAGIPGITLLAPGDEGEYHNYQHVVIEVTEQVAGLSRDTLHRVLWAENVLARRHFYPGIHRMEPYRSDDRGRGAALPHTEHLTEHTLVLPSGGELGPEDVAAVSEVARFACRHGADITERLSHAGRAL